MNALDYAVRQKASPDRLNHRLHNSKVSPFRATNQASPGISNFNFSNIPVNDIQLKLRVSEPNDIYEQQADRVADEVMRMTPPPIRLMEEPTQHSNIQLAYSTYGERQVLRRQAVEENEENKEEEEPYREAPEPIGITSAAMEEEEEEQETLQTKPISNSRPKFSQDIVDLDANSGQYLMPQARRFMEPRFGMDFSTVRIHDDSKAARTANALQARAFTIGPHIYFASAEYQPHSTSGLRLLAHELTHVLQQGRAGVPAQSSMLNSKVTSNLDIGLHHPYQDVVIQRTLAGAYANFRDTCDCGEDLGNNCAHYLSDALIRSGYADLDGGIGARYRRRHGRIVCRAGRPVRAAELRNWFARMASDRSNGEPTNDSRHWAVYQRRARDGQGHVTIHAHSGTGTAYAWQGTGDYPTWRTQAHYTW